MCINYYEIQLKDKKSNKKIIFFIVKYKYVWEQKEKTSFILYFNEKCLKFNKKNTMINKLN